MEKKILDSKAFLIVLSIVLSVALWFYVSTSSGKDKTQWVYDIPVVFSGTDVLEENGLMISSENLTVSIKFQGTYTNLAQLSNKSVSVTVDVSKISEASTYVMGYEISYPSGLSSSNVTPIERSAFNISFDVVKYASKDIEIKGNFTGSLADGYMAGDFSFSPSTITVSGQADLVNQIDYAQVTITGENLSETVTGTFDYDLIAYNGDTLSNFNVERSEDQVEATYPVLVTKDVPLTVDFTDGGGTTGGDVTYTISPSSITVAGEKNDMTSLNSITVATIDLASVKELDSTVVYTIPLAQELTNVSGQTEATVELKLSPNLVTKTLEATNISLINTPDNYSSKAVTTALAVTVRGTAEALSVVSADNIRIVADLSDISLATGQYKVAAKVYFDGTGSAGVVGTDYQIVVYISTR